MVSDEMMVGWLEEYAGVEDYGFGKIVPLAASPYYKDGMFHTRFTYRHCQADGSYPRQTVDGGKPETTILSFDEEQSPLAPLLREATGLSAILTARVAHCKGALAVSLVFPDGFKVSFSGDCRPSPAFASIGRGSTVMIHEATFQNNMAGSALAKKHSTAAEALEVGRMMKARSIILTHFSQRYQKIGHVESNSNQQEEFVDETPKHLDDSAEEPGTAPASMPPIQFDSNFVPQLTPPSVPVVGAFDYMRIRVGDMPITQAYAPAIEKLDQILERTSNEEAEKNKQEMEMRAAEIKQQKLDKHTKQSKKGKSNQGAPKPPPTPATPATDVNKDPKPKHSAWSASESESGWSTSDYESDLDRPPVTPRKNVSPTNYTPPMTRSRSKKSN